MAGFCELRLHTSMKFLDKLYNCQLLKEDLYLGYTRSFLYTAHRCTSMYIALGHDNPTETYQMQTFVLGYL
jgi:hypothetical protein